MLLCGTIAVVLMKTAAGRRPVRQVSAATVDTEDATVATSGDSSIDTPAVEDSDVAVGRPIYRYSVIPGGAYDARELADAVDRDPVVAAAYGGVAAGGVHSEVVAADRLAYMSYRIGDDIYWTRHQIRLHRGETILTDGKIELRGRCGNGISVDPMSPTAESEPGPLELEALVAPASGLVASNPGGLGYVAPEGGIPMAFAARGDFGSSSPLGSFIGAGSQSSLTAGASAAISPQDALPPFADAALTTPAPSFGAPSFAVAPGHSGDGGNPTVLVNIPGGLDPVTTTEFNGGGGDRGPSVPPTSTPDDPFTPVTPVPAPEPGTFLLLGGGLVSIAAKKMRSRG